MIPWNASIFILSTLAISHSFGCMVFQYVSSLLPTSLLEAQPLHFSYSSGSKHATFETNCIIAANFKLKFEKGLSLDFTAVIFDPLGLPRRRILELFLICLLFFSEWAFTPVHGASWPGRFTSGGKVREWNCSWEQMPVWRKYEGPAISEFPPRKRWQWKWCFNCPQHCSSVHGNRNPLFKQMASLPIHNQAFNEIKQSSQGCRCMSPDHFRRYQFNCTSIFVKAVPKCLSCPLS